MRFLIILLFVAISIDTFSQRKEIKDIPYRPSSDFELYIDYDFKSRPIQDNNNTDILNSNNLDSRTVLPYLGISITLLNTKEEEYRYQLIKKPGDVKIRKKIRPKPLLLDLGYTDDMKDRVSPHIFHLIIETKDRQPINRIKIEIKEDGTFLLNEVINGKF